jgi:hypothetical protein
VHVQTHTRTDTHRRGEQAVARRHISHLLPHLSLGTREVALLVLQWRPGRREKTILVGGTRPCAQYACVLERRGGECRICYFGVPTHRFCGICHLRTREAALRVLQRRPGKCGMTALVGVHALARNMHVWLSAGGGGVAFAILVRRHTASAAFVTYGRGRRHSWCCSGAQVSMQ